MRHWMGKTLIALVIICLGLIGLNVSVMTVQTGKLLEIKEKAEASGRQAELAVQKANASADGAILSINRRLSDTEAMRSQALREATNRIAAEGIAGLNRAQIEDRAVSTIRKETSQNISVLKGQTSSLRGQVQALSKDVAKMESARNEIARAQGQIRRYEAEAKTWHDTIEGRKETLRDKALVRATWSVLNNRGWLIVFTLLVSVAAIVMSFLAWRRPKTLSTV